MNISLLTSDKPLKARLNRLGQGKAELVFPDSQIVTISSKYLPSNASEGDFFFLNLLSEGDLKKSKKEIANEVLKEILQ